MITPRTICLFFLAAAVLLFSACDPEPTRVVWSPDGTRAIVLLNDGLHVCDPNGKLAAAVIPQVRCAEWFADSKRLLVLRSEDLTAWKELTKLISDESRQEIVDLAGKMRPEILAYTGDWDKFNEALEGKFGKAALDKYGPSVALYFRAQNDTAVVAKVGGQWNDLTKVTVPASVVQSYEFTGTAFKPGPILLEWAVEKTISRLRLSPTAKHAAISYTEFEDTADTLASDQSLRLGVISLATPDTLRPIAKITACFVDWTADGQYIVFGRSDAPDPKSEEKHRVRLGSISRYQVFDPNATLPEEVKVEDLAGIVYNPFTRVRCLKDGRILFSSVELQIPATPPDMSEAESLFALDPERQATVVKLIPRASAAVAGELMDYFDVSPDEKYVSLMDNEGKVRALTLSTGEIKTLQDKNVTGSSDSNKTKPRIIPTWRTAEELTFAEPIENPAPGTPEARISLTNVLSSVGKSLSDTWPRNAVQGILIAPPEEPKTK